MADVTGAFLSGAQVAQAEQEHEVALQDSKLRQRILKHQVAGLQLEDTLRQRDLQKQQADLGLGQDAQPAAPSPAAAAPTATTGPSGPTAPQSLGDAISEMAKQRITGGATSPLAPPKAKPLPGDIPVPQGTDPKTYAQQRGISDGYVVTDGQGQYYVRPRSAAADAAAQAHGVQPPAGEPPSGQPPTGRVVVPSDAASGMGAMVVHHEDHVPQWYTDHAGGTLPASDQATPPHRDAVWLPALKHPELGIDIPGMWYSPRAAADEQSRRAIALKRAEQPLHNVGPEETALQTNADGSVSPAYTNPNSRGNTPQEKYIAALQKGDVAGAKVILQGIKDTQRPGGAGSLDTMLLDARRKGDTASATLIAGVMRDAGAARRDPAVAADREDQRAFANDMRLYSEDVANGWKKHADAMKLYTNDPLNAVPETAKPAPEYTPPSFEEWRTQHGGKGAATKTGAAAAEKPVIAKASTGKSVSEAELAAIAQKKGTTVDVQRARYKAGGYTIAAPK